MKCQHTVIDVYGFYSSRSGRQCIEALNRDGHVSFRLSVSLFLHAVGVIKKGKRYYFRVEDKSWACRHQT